MRAVGAQNGYPCARGLRGLLANLPFYSFEMKRLRWCFAQSSFYKQWASPRALSPPQVRTLARLWHAACEVLLTNLPFLYGLTEDTQSTRADPRRR